MMGSHGGWDTMELDPVLKKMQHSGRFHKLQTTSWLFVPAFLLVHLLVATCLPIRFDSLSTVFIVLAELAAISTSLRAVRRDAIGRGFWFLLTGAIFFHSAAMTNDALTEFNGGPMFNHVPALSVMLSMFGGVW